MLATPAKCPCCGQPVPENKLLVDLNNNVISYNGHNIKGNRRTCEFVSVLVSAMPCEVDYDRLIARMWGVNEPGNPVKTVHTYAAFARLRLRRLGFDVKSTYAHGYRIVPIN